MGDYKQVIIVRADLKLPKGKMAAQVAHGSVEAALKSDSSKLKKWLDDGQKKVVLKIEDEKELVKIFQRAKDQGLTASLITDAGHTVLKPGTKTVVAIGPDLEENIDLVAKDLKMM
ncbi:MAG: peptidyl-tRNA hydrolase Pth2 [Candidatus Woesearchaeota archaeon]